MILKSFGCSFIFGSDLADSTQQLIQHNLTAASNFTWPALLAQDRGIGYHSFASPGSGNLKIYEKVLTQAQDPQPSIFVIGWSFIDRVDYLGDTFTHGHYDPHGNAFWKSILPGNTDTFSVEYYRKIHNQYLDKLTTLTYVKSAIDVLKAKNIPFVMTYVDELMFETEWHTSAGVQALQDYVRPYMTQFEGKTFLEWSKQKGFPISETLHPLEPAHQAAFELVKSYNLV